MVGGLGGSLLLTKQVQLILYYLRSQKGRMGNCISNNEDIQVKQKSENLTKSEKREKPESKFTDVPKNSKDENLNNNHQSPEARKDNKQPEPKQTQTVTFPKQDEKKVKSIDDIRKPSQPVKLDPIKPKPEQFTLKPIVSNKQSQSSKPSMSNTNFDAQISPISQMKPLPKNQSMTREIKIQWLCDNKNIAHTEGSNVKDNFGEYILWQASTVCKQCEQGLRKVEKGGKCECRGIGITLDSTESKEFCNICFIERGKAIHLCQKCKGKG